MVEINPCGIFDISCGFDMCFALDMHCGARGDLCHVECERRWTELDGVRAYYDFFAEHRDEFEN